MISLIAAPSGRSAIVAGDRLKGTGMRARQYRRIADQLGRCPFALRGVKPVFTDGVLRRGPPQSGLKRGRCVVNAYFRDTPFQDSCTVFFCS